MRRQGGGFGFLMLLVVLAIVAYVAMRNTRSVAPTAMEIQRHNQKRREVNAEAVAPDEAPTSASDDSWNPTPPSRPSLETVDKNTTQHSANVQDALKQAN
jgi:hypothetical protein